MVHATLFFLNVLRSGNIPGQWQIPYNLGVIRVQLCPGIITQYNPSWHAINILLNRDVLSWAMNLAKKCTDSCTYFMQQLYMVYPGSAIKIMWVCRGIFPLSRCSLRLDYLYSCNIFEAATNINSCSKINEIVNLMIKSKLGFSFLKCFQMLQFH